MRRVTLLPLFACAALAACSDSLSTASSAERPSSPSLALGYGGSVIDIGVLPTMTGSAAYDINNNGQVVGYSSTAAGGTRAFIWTSGSGMMALPSPLGGGDTYAFAVNDWGAIAGAAANAEGVVRAVVWNGILPTDLGALPGGDFSVGLGINRFGDVVGYSYTTPTGTPHAFLYSAGRMMDLGTLGGAESMAMDITERGQVVGTAQTSSGASYAFSWSSRSGMQRLPIPAGAVETTALAANSDGDVVGYGVMADNTTRAYLWPAPKKGQYSGGPYSSVVELKGLSANTSSVAFSINANGEIVGYSKTVDDAGRERYMAVYWTLMRNGTYKPTRMNMPLGGEYAYGQAINDQPDGAARVAGIIVAADGSTRAAVWQ